MALTLVRSVGWLSRGDLRMRKGHAGPGLETPEGQSQGLHRFEYALTTYAGDWKTAQVVRCAHEFAYPPAAVLVDRHAGDGTPSTLLNSDNPHVVLSALTPAKRADRFFVRYYNSTGVKQVANVELPAGCRPRSVDFLGAPNGKRLRRSDDRWRLRLGPFEIATLLVTGA